MLRERFQNTEFARYVKPIEEICYQYPVDADIDMMDAEIQEFSRIFADQLLELSDGNIESLKSLETALIDCSDEILLPPIAVLALQQSISKAEIQKIEGSRLISIVVPVYHENTRLRPRGNVDHRSLTSHTEQLLIPHPLGEDFLRQKTLQVEWLLNASPKINYSLIFVDDGCDSNSGSDIENLIRIYGLESTHSILYLSQEISESQNKKGLRALAVRDFPTPKHSIKAGAVYLGMAKALEEGADYIVYTDADLSYSLALVGRMVAPLNNDRKIAVASRRAPGSYLERGSTVRQSGRLLVKAILGGLRTRLLGDFLPSDTQAGFKALTRDSAEIIVRAEGKERTFSFDIYILAILYKYQKEQATEVPTFCLDSGDLSTADNDLTYFNMAKAYIKAANILNANHSESEHLIIELLNDLLIDDVERPRPIWNELHRLLELSESQLLNESIYDIREIQHIKDKFSNTGNSTAGFVQMSDQDLLVLRSIFRKIKVRVL